MEYVVVELPKGTPQEFSDYVKRHLTGPTLIGGFRLDCQVANGPKGSTRFVIGCSDARAAELADGMRIKKHAKDGSMQIFSAPSSHRFVEKNGQIFNVSEKQRLIIEELNNEWKNDSDEFKLPGFPNIKLKAGDHIVSKCLHFEVISQIYPLHHDDLEHISDCVKTSWRRFLDALPIEDTRSYFGESIAMYFSFLEYYSYSLVIPSMVGVVYYLTGLHRTSFTPLIILALFNLIWSTAFIEGWKRRTNTLAYRWGTWDMKSTEIARAEFYGEMSTSPVTGKPEPHYSKHKRLMQYYLVSFPIVLLSLSVCAVTMVLYFKAEDYTLAWYNSQENLTYYHEAVSFVPTIVYSLLIIVMNQLYKPLAIRLTQWENHRLQSTHDNYVTIKLVSFWFVNTFLLMFYVAFIMQDIPMLRKTLLTELIVTQAVDQLQETVLPYIIYKFRKFRAKSDGNQSLHSSGMFLLSTRAQYDIHKQSLKEPYEGTFDDFLELFIQFGYVTLFSCVFPLAALLALVNNTIEMRTDAAKLCYVHQKPFPRLANGIGAWQHVFTAMSYLAIITNTGLIGLMLYQSNMLQNYNDRDLIILVVLLEHALLLLRAAIAFIIPDEDRSVRIAKARDLYILQSRSRHIHTD